MPPIERHYKVLYKIKHSCQRIRTNNLKRIEGYNRQPQQMMIMITIMKKHSHASDTTKKNTQNDAQLLFNIGTLYI